MPHSRALLRLHGTCITKALALCVYGRRGLEIANATAILPHPVIPGSRYHSGLASLLSKVPGKSKVTNLQNTIPTADHIKNESISIMEQTAKFNLSTNTFSKFQMETGDTSGVSQNALLSNKMLEVFKSRCTIHCEWRCATPHSN